MDKSDPSRDRIHEVLQEVGVLNGHEDEDRRALLTGWVVVTEWIDEDGETWLSKAHSASVLHWAANGMHHEALYGDWPSAGDEEN